MVDILNNVQLVKILLLPSKYEIIMVPSNHSNFQYCDSNIGLFSIAPCRVITLNPLCILFGNTSLLLFWWLPFLSYHSFNSLKAIAIRLTLLFAMPLRAWKSNNYCWKSNTIWEAIQKRSHTEKKPWTNLKNSYKNWSNEIKSDKFCYHRRGAIEKSP